MNSTASIAFADRRLWAFVIGVIAVTIGVVLHLPMFWMGRAMGFRMAGMPMDRSDVLRRGRRSIALDLTDPRAIAIVRDLARDADGLIEGFRPGVMERLGLGPEVLLADNPRLAYGRMTGWGQTGPLAHLAGHDINYLAVSGTLGAIGRAGVAPVPPLNLVADFGGGGMLLAFAMTAAILHARGGGQGQVVDCAMTEGSALLAAMIWGFRSGGRWHDERGANILDGGAPFYDAYACRDGGHVAVGSIEPQFYAALRAKLGLADDPAFDRQFDRAEWPALKAKLAALFATRTRAEWEAVFADADLCFAPVLNFAEAAAYPTRSRATASPRPAGWSSPRPRRTSRRRPRVRRRRRARREPTRRRCCATSATTRAGSPRWRRRE